MVVGMGATGSAVVSPASAGAAGVTTQDGVRLSVQTDAANLNSPAALAFVPDGRLFVAEADRVRGAGRGASHTQPALTIADALDAGEQGAFVDIVPHPAFARNRFVYLLFIARSSNRAPTFRLARFREANGSLAERAVLMDGIPAGPNGAATARFGPDGRLYLAVDDLARSSAQDLGSYNGKILRLTDQGATPRDNPRSSPVFSYGHAIPRGLAWHPVAGELWETEQRSTGDVLHRIEPNGNYQWPAPSGSAAAKPGVGLDSMAPLGAAFYAGELIPQFRNDLFFVSTLHRALIRVRFDPKDHRTVVGTERLLEGRFGRLGNVVVGPDGALYVFTSNKSSGIDAQADDDRVLRIAPLSR
jgi:glucose/arabinose dehydrogenase